MSTHHTPAMKTILTLNVDGLDGITVDIIDGLQYAVNCVDPYKAGRCPMLGDVWTRKASEAGTYGGWRWECSKAQALAYRKTIPVMGRIADAIDTLFPGVK